ncbi:Gfo/Idh/MocA family protein [Murimonas intestini]|uniref:Gfo/Idh/MocA family protein n=1 Tax=Murimonas intestini TaxID=1337051 RepID=UPI0011DE1C5F|nr:Gfo/Idh/MocA family oxidoreductase [Murimonas intestini]
MVNKIRVGIIGAGVWGYQHARAFSERNDVEIVGIVGRTEEKTRKRAREFNVPYFLNIQNMLKEGKPDLVDVCLPGQQTFKPLKQLLEAGVPVMTEKPLTYNMEEARELVRIAENKKLFFAIDFNHSCSEAVGMAKRDIEEGRLGEVIFAEWHFAQAGEFPMSHPYLAIIEAQCHGLDMMEYLCGPISSVSADMTDMTGKGSYTTFSLSLRFKAGGVGTFLGSFDSSDNYDCVQEVRINGTKGTISIKNNTRKYIFQEKNSKIANVWKPGIFDDNGGCFGKNIDRHIDKMLEAFKKGDRPPIPAERGLRALETAWAAISAFESGRRILL